MTLLTTITKAIVVLTISAILYGCALGSDIKDSWIGHNWKDYQAAVDARGLRSECYPAGPGVVSCWQQDWLVDSDGIIIGWRNNSRQ